MSNPLSAMLDELMGRNRNATSAEDQQKEASWSDPEVCPYYTCGYCPHDMFTNTRADLGPCNRLHDDKLREQYRKSSRFEKAGLEEEFLDYLLRVQGDMRRKIDRNKQRLDLTQPEEGDDKKDEKTQQMEKVLQLTEKIAALLAQAEQLGEKGEVEEAQKLVERVEVMKNERDQLQMTLDAAAGERAMEVCDICGCFLNANDAPHRLDEHFTGKQHIGFAKIKTTIEEIQQRFAERRERERRERDEKLRRSRERNRDRHHKSRSRDRSHRHTSSSKDRTKKDEKTKSGSASSSRKNIDKSSSSDKKDSAEKRKKDETSSSSSRHRDHDRHREKSKEKHDRHHQKRRESSRERKDEKRPRHENGEKRSRKSEVDKTQNGVAATTTKEEKTQQP